MTLHEAITALLDEYQLDDFVEVFRDEAKQDREFHGLSAEHPRVRRFQEVCRVLREVKEDTPVCATHDVPCEVHIICPQCISENPGFDACASELKEANLEIKQLRSHLRSFEE